MLGRLEKVRERYEEVNRLLSDPAVVSNQERLRNLSKEHSDLTPLIKSYDRYRKLKNDLAAKKANFLSRMRVNRNSIKRILSIFLQDLKERQDFPTFLRLRFRFRWRSSFPKRGEVRC